MYPDSISSITHCQNGSSPVRSSPNDYRVFFFSNNDIPFCLQYCVRTRMKSQGKRAISMLNRPLSLRKLLHEEWTVEHHFMRPTVNNWSWRWNQSQIRHLQDWKFVSRIYKRFSLLGKPLFFQMKTFAILPMEKKNWQSMPIFVGNDNRIALQYIERMVLMESRFNYQPLLLLPQRLKGFSRLRQIKYAFTFSRKTTRNFFD